MKHALSILTRRELSVIRKKIAAFSMIEALLAGSLLALVVFTLSSILIFGQESSRIAGDRQRAAALAEEGLEVIRNMSEDSFSSLVAGPHGLAITGNKWQFSGVEDSTEIFTRSLNISDLDANTKLVSSVVNWPANSQRNGEVTLVSRFTNWRRIGAAVIGNWASTTIEAGYSPSNTSAGRQVVTQGNYAYVALTGTSANNFLVLDISTPATPVLRSQINVTGNITDMAISGNFVYISSTGNSAEMSVIDVTTSTAPVVRRVFDATGSNDGLGIDVIGTTVYLSRTYSNGSGQYELGIFDCSVPATPVLLGSFNYSSSFNDIKVSSDGYAYIATSNSTNEFYVLNVSTPAAISFVDSINIVGANTSLVAAAIDIFDSNADGIEDKVVLGRNGEGRLWLINSATPADSTLILANGYTVPGIGTSNINYLESFNSGKYVALGTSAATAEVVIADITTLASPVILSTINIAGINNFAAMGLTYSASLDRLLAVGTRIAANSNYRLEIIKPN